MVCSFLVGELFVVSAIGFSIVLPAGVVKQTVVKVDEFSCEAVDKSLLDKIRATEYNNRIDGSILYATKSQKLQNWNTLLRVMSYLKCYSCDIQTY